jgi:hypothetical protein
MTLSTTEFCITTLSTKGLLATLSLNATFSIRKLIRKDLFGTLSMNARAEMTLSIT